MKLTIVLIFTFINTLILASEKVSLAQFKIEMAKGSPSYIVKRDKEHKIMQVPVSPGGGEILEIKTRKEFPSIVFVTYNAGQAGTSQFIEIHRAAVWDKKTKEFIGDIPFKKIDPKTKKVISNITWVKEKGSLVIKNGRYMVKKVTLK